MVISRCGAISFARTANVVPIIPAPMMITFIESARRFCISQLGVIQAFWLESIMFGHTLEIHLYVPRRALASGKSEPDRHPCLLRRQVPLLSNVDPSLPDRHRCRRAQGCPCLRRG